jgi:23S rRNA pseudouridine1911/1915/1917 synthase
VLYEDEHLLAVDKPPLLAVHPTASYHRHTVLRRLYLDYPGERLTLVHRLDRETSGVLLVARSRAADRAAKRLIEPGSRIAGVEKIYLAITRGVPDIRMIDRPLERDPTRPISMRVAPPNQGLAARTGVELLEQRAGYALLACQLFTGRQHQLRVHLASVGCPVAGDRRYGSEEPALLRHALHAHRYRLRHPLTGHDLDIVSPWPRDLEAFWAALVRPSPEEHPGLQEEERDQDGH